ncbi:MAG TPA: desulfoferrodoxin [Bacteroidetes bacterium]|nr:desulfoferrodoxin [Bacteroidota bacterium]HEX04527.1 desulfoferrodoxin [Bacteroidota bacterium]
MTEKHQVYVCKHCGNIVDVLKPAGGTLKCCGDDMHLLKENTTDAATEKHVPIIELVDGGIKVTVGEVAHPMVAEHWIEWIELNVDGRAYRSDLRPDDKPEVVFNVSGSNVFARAYCNLHGLWKSA